MAVTIKDVAAAAGVSPSTVSRICNDNPSISKETRDRVKIIMAQLGYEYGTPSAEPVKITPRMVAVVMPPEPRESYGNPFFMEAIRGICEFCNPHHIATTVITGSTEAEILHSVKAVSTQVDGYIMLYAKQDDAVVEYLCENGLLYVVIGTPLQMRDQTICVDNDNLLSAREATDYLYNLGHRRIGFVSKDISYYFSQERKAGYQLSMLQHDLPLYPEYQVELSDILVEGTEKLTKLMSLPNRPTAVLVADDILALALVQVCIFMGLSIPDDVSIISYNNSIFTHLSSPMLTCLDVNSLQLGYEAASQVLNHVANPNLMATRIIVPHRIVERDTCKMLE